MICLIAYKVHNLYNAHIIIVKLTYCFEKFYKTLIFNIILLKWQLFAYKIYLKLNMFCIRKIIVLKF